MKKLSSTTLFTKLFTNSVQEISNGKYIGCVPEHGFYKFVQKDFKYHLMSDLIFFQANLTGVICFDLNL